MKGSPLDTAEFLKKEARKSPSARSFMYFFIKDGTGVLPWVRDPKLAAWNDILSDMSCNRDRYKVKHTRRRPEELIRNALRMVQGTPPSLRHPHAEWFHRVFITWGAANGRPYPYMGDALECLSQDNYGPDQVGLEILSILCEKTRDYVADPFHSRLVAIRTAQEDKEAQAIRGWERGDPLFIGSLVTQTWDFYNGELHASSNEIKDAFIDASIYVSHHADGYGSMSKRGSLSFLGMVFKEHGASRRRPDYVATLAQEMMWSTARSKNWSFHNDRNRDYADHCMELVVSEIEKIKDEEERAVACFKAGEAFETLSTGAGFADAIFDLEHGAASLGYYYLACLDYCRYSIYAWMLVAKKLGVSKDVARLIANIVWTGRTSWFRSPSISYQEVPARSETSTLICKWRKVAAFTRRNWEDTLEKQKEASANRAALRAIKAKIRQDRGQAAVDEDSASPAASPKKLKMSE